jgi:8-oxo-dGTP pyrophosphatase MutT (NUDIX family)
MNLIAIVDEIEQVIETMWGDPNRWMDLQRRIYQVSITLSARDRRAGYSLRRLDLYENSVNPGDGTIEKREVNPLGLTTDSVIQIRGPLYRPDVFAFGNHELTEEEKPAFALPFKGYNGPRTTPLKDSHGRDQRKYLPPLSIKTAGHAIAYLPEHPIALLSEGTWDPLGVAISKALAESGPDAVRAAYFDVDAAPPVEWTPDQRPQSEVTLVTYEPRHPDGTEIHSDPYFTLMADDDGVGFVRCGDGVLVVPLTDDGQVLLTMERSPAFDRDVLALVGGEVEPDELLEETVNRELEEELGWRAGRIDFLGELHPFKYLTSRQFAFLARDLSPASLEGDEAHPVRARPIPLEGYLDLCAAGELQDALAISALGLALAFIKAEST